MLALLPLAAGCAAKKPLPDAQATTAKVEIETLVRGQYAAIERGDLTAWATAFSPDVLLIGTDPGEVMLGRDTVLTRMNKSAGTRMAAELRREYRSTRLHIGIAPDGRAAWVADRIEYKLQGAGIDKTVWFRMSEVLSKTATGWEIRVAHYSIAVPDERAFATDWPLPVEIPENSAPDVAIAALISTGPVEHFPVDFANRQDVLLIGTSEKEWIASGPAVQRFTGQGKPSKLRVSRRGGVHTGIASSLAWAAWNGSLSLPEQPTLPVRILSILLRSGDGFSKVSEHVSIAVPD